MAGRASATGRGTVSVASALVIALGPLFWLWLAVQRASYAGLGRDQGIFQGTAWAIAHGAVLYRDLREINGPLVHEIHGLVRLLGGADAHVLRSFDLVVSSLVFALFGAALPGAIQQQPERRSFGERLAWAAAGCVVLLAQYVSFYNYWHLTQRESFFDWFVLAAFACALRARSSGHARPQHGWLVLAGIASATPWFGKPPCALYTLLHIATFAWEEPAWTVSFRRRLLAFALGLTIGCGLQLAFLGLYCGVPEFVQIYFGDNPRYYRYIWPRSLDDIVALKGHVEIFPVAIAVSLGMTGLVALRLAGRHMLGLALFPLFGIALDVAQGKAFQYHLHPVTAGAAALGVALSCRLAESTGASAPERASWLPAVSALSLSSVLAGATAFFLTASPFMDAPWAVQDGATAQQRRSARYLRHYDTRTFAGVAMHQVGAFLQRSTRPDDRIQLYGMDPYLLALAERHSATPYIYGIDLNPDAVLEGIAAQGGSAAASSAAQAIARRNVEDFVSRVLRANPAAFVFYDRAPFMHPKSGLGEFLEHVPQLGALLHARYRSLPAVGLLHVYMRIDRWPNAKDLQSLGTGMPPVSSK